MENRPLRIMPNNQEAEQSVIGSMILDKNAIATVLEQLHADDFHRDAHRIRPVYTRCPHRSCHAC